MFLQKKALYNLIQLNLNQVEEGKVNLNKLEPWQIENYRTMPTEDLFYRLHELKIPFNMGDFGTYAQRFESPEEMSEALTKDTEPAHQDRVFLVIFELWRRLVFEKRSLSIFCDELDYQIMSYDLGKSESPTDIQDALAYLQKTLEDYADEGEDPQTIFRTIQSFCANDLESFLFDYILEQIEADNYAYSIDLIDGFFPFILDTIWFEYLKARAILIRDPEEGFERLEKVIENVDSFDLAIEIFSYLAETGNHSLFYSLAEKIIPYLEIEEDFIEFIELCWAHYRYLEIEVTANAIMSILENRKSLNIDPFHPFLEHDSDLLNLQLLLKRKLQFAAEG